jgi:hypothetical protein
MKIFLVAGLICVSIAIGVLGIILLLGVALRWKAVYYCALCLILALGSAFGALLLYR